ncbi:hypothetical protein HBJ16_002495 [Pseudomonas sp. CES]|nr:hypothetical protein HBJ16_002495 [Pseudomonas sp. CES]
MRYRGEIFWAWADPVLKHYTHQVRLPDGAWLDIQARVSSTDVTQLFIGIYESSDFARIEEAYAKRPGETVSRAIAWATDRGRTRL